MVYLNKNHNFVSMVINFVLLIPVSPSVLLCVFGSVTAPNIDIKEEIITRQDGSCVTIDCTYKLNGMKGMTLLWIKDPKWNDTQKRFNGTIVYSNTQERPQDSEYTDRVEFVQEKKYYSNRATCTLKINNLNKKDNGNYTFRYIKENDKHKGNEVHLIVAGESYDLC